MLPDRVVDFGLGQPLLRGHFYNQCSVSRPCNGVYNGIGIILVCGVHIFVEGSVAQAICQSDSRMRDKQPERNPPEYSAYISTNEEYDTNILRYGYSSMLTPSSVYDYNMETKEKTLLKQTEVIGKGYDKSLYDAETIYATARDGEKIPIYLVFRKDMRGNKPQPLLLYSYGSYGSTSDPYFSSTRLSLL